jgi:hypothetical protein
MVESDIVLLYIRSRVWRIIYVVGPSVATVQTTIDEVSEALSIHAAPPAIQIVVVPAGVTVLLGLHNPPRSWTGMVDPSLPSFTIVPCVDFLLCYRIYEAA